MAKNQNNQKRKKVSTTSSHKCSCSKDCRATVKSKGRKYALGHNPSSLIRSVASNARRSATLKRFYATAEGVKVKQTKGHKVSKALKRKHKIDKEFHAESLARLREVHSRPSVKKKLSIIRSINAKRLVKEGKITGLLYLSGKQLKTSRIEKKVGSWLRLVGIACLGSWRIPGTHFTADIYIPSVKLIVEVDGHPSHYYDAAVIKKDRRRDRVCKTLGYNVLRLRQRTLNKGPKGVIETVQARIASLQ